MKVNDARENAWTGNLSTGQTLKSSKTRRNRINRIKPYDESGDLRTCPCSVDQVLSLGIRTQYYIADIYLELEKSNQGIVKNQYKKLALNQLEAKDEIEKLANYNLNKLLAYFYDNGGPIIDPPLSEQMAREIQPFYNRVLANFLKHLDFTIGMASKGNLSFNQLKRMINDNVIDMYTTMRMLIPVDEIQDAFDDLIRVRESICNK